MRPTYTTNIWGPNTKQAFTGTAATFTPTIAETQRLRLYSDQDCRIKLGGDSPEADANSTLLPAGVIEYVSIRRGWELSVIRDSQNGTLEITEVTP